MTALLMTVAIMVGIFFLIGLAGALITYLLWYITERHDDI